MKRKTVVEKFGKLIREGIASTSKLASHIN